MIKTALASILREKFTNFDPSALTDAYGNTDLKVFFEEASFKVDRRAGESVWLGTAVAVVYSIPALESLAHQLALEVLSLSCSDGSLTATGSAVFKTIKEGLIDGIVYAELRFEMNWTVK